MRQRKIVQVFTEYNEQSGHGMYVVCEDGTLWIRVSKYSIETQKNWWEWEPQQGPHLRSWVLLAHSQYRLRDL